MMKTKRAAKVPRTARAATTEQIVLDAFLNSTKDRAFRAFARRLLIKPG